MLLEVNDLRTHFFTPAGVLRAVNGASFAIPAGQTLALVGESGCGKSVTGLSILQLVSPPGRVVSGEVVFGGRDLLGLSGRQMRAIRGDRIAMIFQEPMSSLNPLLPAGAQIDETLRLHRGLSGRAGRRRTVELLHRVRLPAPERLARSYPHELSGGMRQRVMIAMAVACEPELLIADEPTTALDVTVQAEILVLLRDLQRESGLSMLFITHDLGVVARVADRVAVMYAGRIVEQAATEPLLNDPRHPYTRALLRATPRLRPADGSRRLPTIPGEVPSSRRIPPGCAFHPRCDLGSEDPACRREVPGLRPTGPNRCCACWKVAADPARPPPVDEKAG